MSLSGSGDSAQPTAGNPSVFTRGAEGAPVLYGSGGRGVVNLGAGTPENYVGPFAITYDAEKKGFEYAWALSKTLDDNGTPKADVEAIYVDEVCRYDSFSTLGL